MTIFKQYSLFFNANGINIPLTLNGFEVKPLIIDDRLHVVADACADKFHGSLLHRPEADESGCGILCRFYFKDLLVVHRITNQSILVFTDTLHIDAHGLIIDSTDSCILAMAQVKVYLWMSYNGRFTMLIVLENGILRDAVFLSQPLLQQLIGQHTEPLPQFIPKLQGLFPSLL